jgi:hypothetical protein
MADGSLPHYLHIIFTASVWLCGSYLFLDPLISVQWYMTDRALPRYIIFAASVWLFFLLKQVLPLF